MKRRITAVLIASFAAFRITCAQSLAVSTNVVDYAVLGTMNLEVSYALQQHWSIAAGARYNPFTFEKEDGEQFQLRQRTFALGARWWPWHIYSGWWLSPKVRYMEYSAGGVIYERTKEGDRIGVGAAAGYTHMISSHLNIEFGAGFWGGYEKYTLYSCPHCGYYRGSDRKSFLLPDDLIIAICYVF